MASSKAVDDVFFDCLPSIRRPAAWETPGRSSRQIASDTESIHSADELFARTSTVHGRRTVYSSSASPGRRPIIEVTMCTVFVRVHESRFNSANFNYRINCAVSQHLQDSTMDVYHDTKGLFLNTQSINYSSIT